MLDQLLKRLGQALNANPFEGFLGQLWQVWNVDAGRAVLLARWHWQQLPAHLDQQAALAQQQARAANAQFALNQEVSAQLGAMGVFPGHSSSVGGFGSAMNPDQMIFVQTLAMIRQSGGDPPTTHEAVQVAEGVLRGQVDPLDAMIAAAPPHARQQMQVVVQALRALGNPQIVRLQAILTAASALPRDRIPILIPELAQGG